MSDNNALDTLFLPFEDGTLDWHADTLFLYADWHPSLKPCDVLHVDKPSVDRLAAHGFQNLPRLERSYARILVQIPKQVQEAQGLVALALDHTAEGGILILAADNDANGKRLQGWLEEAGFTDISSESKNRARVVWATKTKSVSAPATWAENFAVRPVEGFFTRPGLFSWDSIDRASQLLVDHLPENLSGDGADFGCGWGYLSVRILKNNKSIKSLVMIDADSRAVACAGANTESVQPATTILPFWHDLTKPLPQEIPLLDFIIMNPPFHTGKKTDLDLGLAFIRTAWAQLKRGGTLYMVANTHLRYEEALEKIFKSVVQTVQKNGFKVIKAVKG